MAGKSFLEQISTSKRDISEIQGVLKNIRSYYNDISNFYSIKEDIVEIKDKRRGLSKLLERQIENFKSDSKELTNKINDKLLDSEEIRKRAEALLIIHEKFDSDINEIRSLLDVADEEGHTFYEKLKDIVSAENVTDLSNKSNEINSFWVKLFEKNEGEDNVFDETKRAYSKINEIYNDFVKPDDSGLSKEKELNNYYSKLKEEYQRIVTGYTRIQDDKEISITSYAKQIKEQKSSLNEFHHKIFGDKNTNGLENELDVRLEQLSKIEEEAKKVIGLSSDAGLAGGFTERGRKAKYNKYISSFVFISVLLVLGLVNLFDFESSSISFKHIENIENLNMLFVKLVYNIPFIWIAIVANVNLNKYSRLEEEYAHKESLAKSFERYKEQIQNIDDDDESNELMLRLLNANISAFEKNAADTMNKAKADTIFDSLISRKKRNKIEGEKNSE